MRFTLFRMVAVMALGAPGAALAFQTSDCRFDQRCVADGLCEPTAVVAQLQRSTPIDAVIGFQMDAITLGLSLLDFDPTHVVWGADHDSGAFMLRIDQAPETVALTFVGLDGKVDWVMHGTCGDFQDA